MHLRHFVGFALALLLHKVALHNAYDESYPDALRIVRWLMMRSV